MRLDIPNTNPRNAPAFGPRRTAPTATGTTINVICVMPMRKYPSGVNAIRITIAVSRAVSAIVTILLLETEAVAVLLI